MELQIEMKNMDRLNCGGVCIATDEECDNDCLSCNLFKEYQKDLQKYQEDLRSILKGVF